MSYWWVNQNKTHKAEISGGFLWSPKTKSNGTKNPFYEYMTRLQPYDVVFSFYQKKIQAFGIVTSRAESSIKPDFGKAGDKWSSDGWLVNVDFTLLENPVTPKDHEGLLNLIQNEHAPLKKTGDGKEFYLTYLEDSFSQKLIRIINIDIQIKVAELRLNSVSDFETDYEKLKEYVGRTDIGDTTKKALVDSRRGQGVFKTNVRLNEKCCRVTGVRNIKFLTASHIKPWSESTDTEKLNGCNGLLLSPHVDRLFDRGYISFSDQGKIIISPKLDIEVIKAWGIDIYKNVGKFNSSQKTFLKHHRDKHKLS
jgi:putative restriction endonuclease